MEKIQRENEVYMKKRKVEWERQNPDEWEKKEIEREKKKTEELEKWWAETNQARHAANLSGHPPLPWKGHNAMSPCSNISLPDEDYRYLLAYYRQELWA
jgi:hypothetical protein